MYSEEIVKSQRIGLLNSLVVLFFCVGYGGAGIIFFTITEGEGNGGAFKAMLAILLLSLGAIVTTSLGLFSTVRGFILDHHKSEPFFNSPWFSLLLSSPPIILYGKEFIEYVFIT